MIKIQSATKRYRNEQCIGPIDLTIPKASFTSLIGPNGAGKSTMLLSIGRLLKIDEGQIFVNDLDVSCKKSKDLSKVLAIMQQENHYVTRLTVRQLVSFGRFPYSKGRLTQADDDIIEQYIDFFNLKELEHCYLDELSGGQRQRAYVAMVLCQDTEYVLLDEPLNNLDIANSVQMMQHLRRAVDEFGRTIVLVLHDINFAARYSDYICALKNGHIVEFGKTAEVMQSDTLSDIYDTKIEVLEGPYGAVALY